MFKEKTEAFAKSFNMEMFELAFHLIILFVLVALLKYVAESISGFIRFKISGHVIKGTPVEVYDRTGFVKTVSWNNITIQTEDGWFSIPMKDWASSKYMKLKIEKHPSNKVDS